MSQETIEYDHPLDCKSFSSPSAFALIDADGVCLYVGMSRGGGAAFNPYRLPDYIGRKEGVRLRVYPCETATRALWRRVQLIATEKPRYNHPHPGRPMGAKDREPRRGRRGVGPLFQGEVPPHPIVDSDPYRHGMPPEVRMAEDNLVNPDLLPFNDKYCLDCEEFGPGCSRCNKRKRG